MIASTSVVFLDNQEIINFRVSIFKAVYPNQIRKRKWTQKMRDQFIGITQGNIFDDYTKVL